MAEVVEALYQPLSTTSSEIRLLLLRAGQSSDSLIAHLAHFPLHSSPPFFALSYTWGNALDTRHIILNTRNFKVTANLDQALRALRKVDGDSYYWIDAICINQDDLHERNTEVPRMRDIYEAADSVIAWLGPGNAVSDSVIDFVTTNEEDVLSHHDSLKTEDLREKVWWAMIRELLMRPWWQRVWVIQEVAVAKEVMVHCGSRSLVWGLLGEGVKIVIELHGKESLQGDMYSALNRAVELRNIRTRRLRLGRSTMDWKELILRARASLVTHKVDKIYGLLGLATQGQLPGLLVDYDTPVEDVFTQFTNLLCQKEQRLDLICLANRTESALNLPSWAPDLSAVFRVKPLNKMRLETRYRAQFDANGTADESGKLTKDENTSFTFSKELGVLYSDGLIIDTIAKLAATGMGDEQRWDQIGLDCRQRAMTIANDACDPCASYVLGGPKYNAFVQTLVADTTITRGTYQQYSPSISLAEAKDKNVNSSTELLPEPDPMLISRANFNRRFIVSSKGYMGLVPRNARANDMLCVLFGCDVPVVIREAEGYHVFIGECYVHGFMNGLALEMWRRGEIEKKSFSMA